MTAQTRASILGEILDGDYSSSRKWRGGSCLLQ